VEPLWKKRSRENEESHILCDWFTFAQKQRDEMEREGWIGVEPPKHNTLMIGDAGEVNNNSRNE